MLRRLIRIAIIVWVVRQALRYARANGIELGPLDRLASRGGGRPGGRAASGLRSDDRRSPFASGTGPSTSGEGRSEFAWWGDAGSGGRGALADAAPGSPERRAALRNAADEARARLEETARREAETAAPAASSAAPADPGDSTDASATGATTAGSGRSGGSTGDDLKIIEGIGPRIAGVLMAAGVDSFAQLSEMRPGRIETIIREAGVRMANPSTWPEQARLAAAGDWGALADLQSHLKGGRELSTE